MAIQPYDPTKYVLLTPMWEVFTDKDLLTFLHGGYAIFWEDDNRAQYKEVFELVDTGGAYPNYTYQPYGFLNLSGQWQVDLNSQGAFDQVVYGFPFNDDGDPQLYFIQFYNSDGVFQFSREAWPNLPLSVTPVGTVVDENFVPNPQFYLHTNIPNPYTPGSVTGQVTALSTNIAYGGWTFQRSNTSSTDIITFPRISSFITPPPDGNPRYSIGIQCTGTGAGQTFKGLYLTFNDVNKFATTLATPTTTPNFTLAFTGINNGIGTVPITVTMVRNFGSGGSPTIVSTLDTINITTSYPVSPYTVFFDFPTNAAQTIGPNDDDYVALSFQMPLGASYNIELANFILTPGIVANPAFPEVPDTVYLYQSLFVAGPPGFPNSTPDYNSLDLGLPLILGQQGITYDGASIGTIEVTVRETLPFGRLVCDGLTSYDSRLYSSDGIPYIRLNEIMNDNSLDCPFFGTGPQFVTVTISTMSTFLKFSNNSPGALTAPADGAIPTGFTFNNCTTGFTKPAGYGVAHYAGGNPPVLGNLLYWINDDVGTSYGFPTNEGQLLGITTFTGAPPGAMVASTIIDTPFTRSFYSLETVSSATIPASSRFYFHTTGASGAAGFYVWFKVDGVGTDPAVAGYTGIEVDLFNTTFAMADGDVAQAITDGMSARQCSYIRVVAGGAIPAGSYWTFTATIGDFYVWYTVDTVGVDPAPAGKIGIQVAVLSTDTILQVMAETTQAINARYFATPDLRGNTLRFWSQGLTNLDLDQALRWSNNSIICGNTIGTMEWYNTHAHNHQFGGFLNDLNFVPDYVPPPWGFNTQGGVPFVDSFNNDFNSGFAYSQSVGPGDEALKWGLTGYSGAFNANAVTDPGGSGIDNPSGSESRSVNIYVNAFIRY